MYAWSHLSNNRALSNFYLNVKPFHFRIILQRLKKSISFYVHVRKRCRPFFFLVCSLVCQWPAPNSTDWCSSLPACFDPKWHRRETGLPFGYQDNIFLFGSMPFRAGQGLVRYLINVFLKCLLPSKPAKRFSFFWRGICLLLSRFLEFCVRLWK